MGGNYTTESLFQFQMEERLQCVESSKVCLSRPPPPLARHRTHT
jgi:uncharacterized UBP type Zn finger protein